MKTLTIRSSLMATLASFTFMVMAGAALGMVMLSRANDGFLQAQEVSEDILAINDIYKDTARTRIALARVYLDVKEVGREASASNNLVTAQKYRQRGQSALDSLVNAVKSPAPEARLRGDLIAALRNLYVSLDRAIVALRADDVDTFNRINLTKLAAEGANVSNLLDRFQKQNNEHSKELIAQRSAEYRTVNASVALGILLALALVVGVGYFLKRAVLAPLENAIDILETVACGDLTRRVPGSNRTEIGRLMAGIADMQTSLIKTVAEVRGGADSIAHVAHEVAAGNMDLSARTEAQAGSLQETAASMEELTITVQQTVQNTEKACEMAGQASRTATVSSEVMCKMADMMAQIESSSHRVSEIIGVIDGIAFQTDILALNAAVEAARAGDHGRGFAVVASEVRTLAQRSAVAAKEIRGLIDASVANVRSGSGFAEQARRTMRELADSVRNVSDIVIDIAEACREQGQGISQVNRAISDMDEVTQRNAALVEQAAAATRTMSDETDRLLGAVSVFKTARCLSSPPTDGITSAPAQ